ncbi:hypothetical protein [Herbidospora sp. NBRC 101105]|uniref:hypothetical protein n=1 Tax=Herbidospora sp. NBRC 101105 TaxID=3032195 RepID=UPI0024A285B1|nr:hypothetical protein [Herbidospora sp. NBRC 101105]GLX92770.1 hypothetical protein Hesp01_07200 [Herbidospora sp. NBRC 101105]
MRDDALMEELATALRAADPVPPGLVEMGQAIYTWRLVDAELAELSPAGTAGPLVRADEVAALRDLAFQTESGLVIELGVSGDALLGQLDPPAEGEVRVVTGAGPGPGLPVDEVGGFRISPIPPGRFRLHFRGGGRDVVTTPIYWGGTHDE